MWILGVSPFYRLANRLGMVMGYARATKQLMTGPTPGAPDTIGLSPHRGIMKERGRDILQVLIPPALLLLSLAGECEMKISWVDASVPGIAAYKDCDSK